MATKVLSNGAIYDTDAKKIVAMRPDLATKNTQITSENAGAMQARLIELKREAVRRGANAVVSEGGKYDGTDFDFVEAIAEVQTIKALNPDDAKSTDAARFVFQEAGIAEAKQAQQQGDAVTVTLSAQGLQALAAMLAGNGNDNNNYRNHADIVDAAGIEGEAGGAAADSGGEKQ